MLTFDVRAIETVRHLRSDVSRVVSFDYVVVAAGIVGVVSASLGAGAGGIGAALSAVSVPSARDQAERDHAALKAAVRKGKVTAYQEV